MRYFLFLVLVICSCGKKHDDKGTNEVRRDSLAMFPLDYWMTFVRTNADDQIALLFKRDTSNTFEYRIELLRKWKSLPHDYGLQLREIEGDSIYIFRGGNFDCEVVIKICNAKEKFELGQDYVKLKRNCKNDSLDITEDEFQKLWYK